MAKFINVSEDRKTISMDKESHTATISLFGVKVLVGYNKEEKAFSFGINKTKLVNQMKKLVNKFMDNFHKTSVVELDDNSTLEEEPVVVEPQVEEPVQAEADDEELVIKASNYLGTVKLFGLGLVISFNKKYENFVNFKEDRVKETYNGLKLQSRK